MGFEREGGGERKKRRRCVRAVFFLRVVYPSCSYYSPLRIELAFFSLFVFLVLSGFISMLGWCGWGPRRR